MSDGFVKVRTVCGTPCPRVLAWNSHADNPVGAEYIIMKKATGVQLASVWPTMPFPKKLELIQSIGRLEHAWTAVSFQQYGSLCYASDVLPDAKKTAFAYLRNGQLVEDPRFRIGPAVNRQVIDNERNFVDFDRGPCTSRGYLDRSYR